MINSDQRSCSRMSLAGAITSSYTRAEPKCYCCGERLALYGTPLRVPAGFRLQLTHTQSGERDLSRFGVCASCCLVFEDVNAVMAVYEQVRQQVLLAIHRARLAHELLDGGDARAALSELAAAFPCLEGQPGVRPFSARRFNDWMCETALVANVRDCTGFVLHVADASSLWARQFDVVRAMERWEPAERAVFIEWAKAPWWA
jgi:hypothetical protein